MKIAFISTILGYPWGGADVLWTRTAQAAQQAGHVVLVAVAPQVADHPRVAGLRSAGAVLHRRTGFTQQRGRRDRWRQALQRKLRSPRELTAALDSFRPDFVFISQGGVFDFLIEDGLNHWLTESACPFSLICQSNDERDQLSPESQTAARRILSRARNVFFVSTHNRDHAVRQVGAPIARAIVVPNPLELTAASLPLPWPEAAAPRFAIVARLETDQKGLDVLLAALARIPPGGGWQVDLFGRGPDEAALRARAAALGLGPRLDFRGYEPEVQRIWASHHWLILPSRREGCALAMLEALACGRPVIATDVGGVRDWIESGVNGFVCPPGDAHALADTLIRVLSQPATWPAMGAAAARMALPRLAERPEQILLGSIAITHVPGK